MRIAPFAMAVLVAVMPLTAQQRDAVAPPVFEVASIRPASFPDESYFLGFAQGAGDCGLYKFTPTGNRVYLGNVTLCMLIRMAYDVTSIQIAGLPEWSHQLKQSAWYQVEARAETGTVLTLDQARAMLRALLSDRFNLRFHREARDAPVYALVVDKPGHKLSTTDIACPVAGATRMISFPPGTLISCKPDMSMSQLVYVLDRELDRPVVDKTGLAGRYALVLKFTPADSPAVAAAGAAPSIFTAVKEQLGLRLEPSTEPVDALVIDQVEPPTPN